MITTTRAHGPDASKWDLFFNPENATEKLDFVIQRGSYGTTKDELFDEINVGVQQVPIRLAYHYLSSGIPWNTQYDKFMSVVGDKGFHAYVCDFETAFNTMSVSFAKSCWDFLRQIAIDTGKRAILYTGRYHYMDWLVPAGRHYNLNWDLVDYWQAQYFFTINPDGQPVMPVGRNTGWNLWQYRSNANGTLYGLGRSAEGDLNVFNGTVPEMRSWLGLNPEPTPGNPLVSFKFNFNGKIWEANDVELQEVS